MFQKFRAQHCKEPFNIEDVLYGDTAADQRIEAQYTYMVLKMVLDTPEFTDYAHHSDSALDAPPAVLQLECGPEHTTKQFMLGTAELEEASYEGTLKVIMECFRQLHLDSKDQQIRTALEQIIAWIGDQMTVDRLRGLWKYRHEDFNSFDRMDYMIPIFGWFHLVMAFANSLHKQYLEIHPVLVACATHLIS